MKTKNWALIAASICAVAVISCGWVLGVGRTWENYRTQRANEHVLEALDSPERNDYPMDLTSTTPTPSEAPRSALPGEGEQDLLIPLKFGEPFGVLAGPHIGRNVLAEGSMSDEKSTEVLDKGYLARYPESSSPEDVNGVIAFSGHRTTHGAPLYDLDKVSYGDVVTMKFQGIDGNGQKVPVERRYRFVGKLIASPTDTWVVDPLKEHRNDHHPFDMAELDEGGLVLTTCHPKHSSQLRLVVFFALDV